MNRARPGESRSPASAQRGSPRYSPGYSPGGDNWQRKTVRELEAELETAAHFIRKMQETEEVLSNHVRDVVAEKNDAVQQLARLQGRVAGLESQVTSLSSQNQTATAEGNEAQRELDRMRREQKIFQERCLEKNQADRHQMMIQITELQGKLNVEEAKQQPLLEQVNELRSELVKLKHERTSQDELIAELHQAAKTLKHGQEIAMQDMARQDELAQHTVSQLETALESAGIQAQKANKARVDASMSTGMKLIAGEMRRMTFSAARNALVEWNMNKMCAEESALRAYQEGLVTAGQQNLSLKLIKGVMSRLAKGLVLEALTNWQQNRLQQQGSAAQSISEQLQARLSSLMEEHQETLEALRVSDEERHRLQTQLKETNAERQILVMEVENLKTVGEQLVSDLVATASEVFDELQLPRNERAIGVSSTIPNGPTAKRIAKSIGTTGGLLHPSGR